MISYNTIIHTMSTRRTHVHHIYIYTYIYIYTCWHSINTYECIPVLSLYMYIHIYIYTCIHICIYTQIYTCVYIYIYTHAHICIPRWVRAGRTCSCSGTRLVFSVVTLFVCWCRIIFVLMYCILFISGTRLALRCPDSLVWRPACCAAMP